MGILEKMKPPLFEFLTKPPPERDFVLFRNIGLSDNSNNLYHLKEHKHVSTAKIEKVF